MARNRLYPAGWHALGAHCADVRNGLEKNACLNNVVAVGVYRPDLGKIAYRVYRIL
jgi:hypothetical protein